MAITAVVLAEGQLPASKGTLYTAAATTYVKFLHLANVSADSNVVIIYVNTSGTSRVIGRASLDTNESADIIDKDAALTLEVGDLIEGEATKATEVDYVITGATE